jgi:hypothetical protein
LLGDLRRSGDVDDERHATLLGDLRDRSAVPRVERTNQHVRALVDQLLSARARRLGVRLRVRAHDLEIDPEQSFEDFRSEHRSAIAGLTDLRLNARLRKQNPGFELTGCAGEANLPKERTAASGCERVVERTTTDAKRIRHGTPRRGMYPRTPRAVQQF